MRRVWLALLISCVGFYAQAATLEAELGRDPLPHAADFANILLTGPIVQGDSVRFRNLVRGLLKSGRYVRYVKTYSPGGSMYDGIAIGEQIRVLRAATVAPKMQRANELPVFAPIGARWCQSALFKPTGLITFDPRTGSGDSRCDCASACFIVWAGGWGRSGDVLGVHRMRFSDIYQDTTEHVESLYDKAMADLRAYFVKMAIPGPVIAMMLGTSSDRIHYLTKEELQFLEKEPVSIEELELARCGRNPGMNAGSAFNNYMACAHEIIDEEGLRGARDYLHQYQD